MDVPIGVWIGAVIISIIIGWLSIWTINKGYSKRWEDDERDDSFK